MTMPQGSTEEPTVIMEEEPTVAVRVVSSGKSKSIGAEFGRWRTFALTPGGQSSNNSAGVRIANRSLRRKRVLIKVNASLPVAPGNPTPATPAVPGSTTAIQNPNPYPVTVVITGGTMSAVIVNGVTVGTGAGTYIVPAAGSISLTYTVAPTWAWSNANNLNNPTQLPTDGIFLVDSNAGNNVVGPITPPFVPATYGNGGYLQINDNVRWEVQQELWAIPVTTNSAPVYVTVCDEQYASDPFDTQKGDV